MAHHEAPPLRIRVDLLPPTAIASEEVAIVVDVLRMTTTATVLAELGLEKLTVVAQVERARQRARAEGALLLGERNALPLPGFNGGNSPREFTEERVSGRTAVLCTTNGSAAVEACAGAGRALLGSLRNASATARLALASVAGSVRVVCAGTAGAVSLDDVVAAGRIVAALALAEPTAELDDTALLARAAAAGELRPLLEGCRHGRALGRAGFAEDIGEAARLDVSTLVMERLAGSPDAFAPVAAVE